MESAYLIGKNPGATASTLALSAQQFVSCDKSDGGCNGGWPATALKYAYST